jgi:hypothetical protein
MPKKMERDSVCLLQAFKHGHKTRCLEPEAFRLNVGNLTTEYQYAAALRGFPLIKLRRTRSFAMTCLPYWVNRKTVTGEGRQQAASGAGLPMAGSPKGSHNDTSAR